MKSKRTPEDFRVQELLREGFLLRSGPHRVYRVTKRKLTSLEAAAALAELAGVPTAEVELAGLKDRQGVTVQHMSVRGGREARLREPGLTIELVGHSRAAISSAESEGNAFRIRLRDLEPSELRCIEAALPSVREHGAINYFDEQRFGNLRHDQGWIAAELCRGRTELALRRLLCARSDHEAPRQLRFKTALDEAWGDWRACRELAGRLGAHHSVFDHLRREPRDFAGAFRRVAQRLRLIHLYAFQSHLWNRAVARLVAEESPPGGACVARSIEGQLVFPLGGLAAAEAMGGRFRLPGERLADVEDPRQRALLKAALADHGLHPDRFQIHDVPGFRFKGEDRELWVRPDNLRVRLPSGPGATPAARSALLSFALPRGAYATLVLKRLLAWPVRGRVRLDSAGGQRGGPRVVRHQAEGGPGPTPRGGDRRGRPPRGGAGRERR